MSSEQQGTNKPGLALDYPHHRRDLPRPAINCYTGGIAHLLAQQGSPISESLIWSLGEGYLLRAERDEFEVPELRVDMFDIVDRFAAKTGTEILRPAVDRERRLEQLAALTAEGSVVAQTNSKHLRYSDLYYSSAGYLHWVVIESVDPRAGTARIVDTLIVTRPPRACEADMPIGDLLAALTTQVSASPAGELDKYVLARAPDGLLESAARQLKSSLRASASEVLAAHIVDSPILAYAASCSDRMARLEGDPLRIFLRRINDNINTLHVMPNRNLLLKSLVEAAAPAELDRAVVEAATAVSLSWKTLANLCLKASITLSRTDLARFQACVDHVDRDELRFWQATAASLDAP